MNTVSAESFEKALDKIRELSKKNTELLFVVRECVNFLADLNSTASFPNMVHRAKALHKRAYTAHSKAKE